MTKESMGDKKPTDKPAQQMSLSDAIDLVNAAIRSQKDRLNKIARQEDQEYVLVSGLTSRGYEVQVPVDPELIVKIMLDYNYPLFNIMSKELPQEMWDKMAHEVGLESVFDVDIILP